MFFYVEPPLTLGQFSPTSWNPSSTGVAPFPTASFTISASGTGTESYTASIVNNNPDYSIISGASGNISAGGTVTIVVQYVKATNGNSLGTLRIELSGGASANADLSGTVIVAPPPPPPPESPPPPPESPPPESPPPPVGVSGPGVSGPGVSGPGVSGPGVSGPGVSDPGVTF